MLGSNYSRKNGVLVRFHVKNLTKETYLKILFKIKYD